MKQIIKILTVTACAIFASGVVYADATKVQLSVATINVTPFCMTLGILRNPNFTRFQKKYNLDLEAVQMQESQAPLTTSNQDLPIGECSGISTVMNAWNKGAKNLIVFAVGAKLPVYQLVAAPSIKSLDDLKGKKIGTPGLQTASTEAVEMILLRGAHLVASKDYDLVSVGAGSARIAALSAGTISALPTYPPDSYDLAKLGYNVLANESTYVPQYVSGVYIVNREWAEKNRGTLIRIIKGIVETGQWLKNPADKNEVIAWLSKNMRRAGGVPLGDEDAARLYQFLITGNRLAFDGYAPESAVRANLDIMEERGFLKEKDIPPLGTIFDFSYLNTALKELGLPPVADYPTVSR